jgi:carbamate kinase
VTESPAPAPARPAPLAVVALGGNALARRGEPLDPERQRERVRAAARALAELARDHRLVVTHGNGPQVGLLALQSAALPGVPPAPLDVLGAESEGMIGYWIEQELANALPGAQVATLLTQVEVDPRDPAFARPTKPIGPVYAEAEARRLAAERGWSLAPDRGGLRRVVASPVPRRILELRTIALLVAAGVLVVCSGGGGIPVVRGPDGGVRGVEAVIDKDRSAALLAADLGAERLVMLTDVGAVYADWPEPARRPIRSARAADLDPAAFDAGSMAPKIDAARRFLAAGGRSAHIGALEEAAAVAAGRAGTRIVA